MHYLVVADRTATSPKLMRKLAQLASEDPARTYVTLLLPVVMAGADWADESATGEARRRAWRAQEELRTAGIASAPLKVPRWILPDPVYCQWLGRRVLSPR